MHKRKRRSPGSGIINLITGQSGYSGAGRPAVRRRGRGVRTARRGGTGMRFEVESHIAREIFAVIYLAFSFLVLLSIYGQLGAVGEILHNVLKPIFGFGIHLIPIVFFGISLALFFAKKSPFTISKITGLILLFLSLLSIFHLSVPTDEILNAAQAGTYGGYIGFIPNFFFRDFLNIGNLGASIVFVATFIVSALLTFEISIVNLIRQAKPEIRLERRKRFAVTDEGIVEVDDDEADIKEESAEDEEESEINIIKPQAPIGGYGGDDDGVLPERDTATAATDEQKSGEAEFANNAPLKAKKLTVEWVFPPLDLLENPLAADAVDDELLKNKAEMIRTKLEQFGINVAMSDVHVGPTVIQYTLKPHEGVKLSKITTLKNDLALALAARAIRIEAPIPGKSLVGIEIPNEQRTIVRLREILDSDEFKEGDSKLKIPLGRTVSGKPMVIDLVGMPHMLIAGATGSGKSVGMNSLLLSLLYQNSPQDLKLIMIDPKRVELNTYNGIPHLLTPVITDLEKAAISLKWAVAEMNRRYVTFAETGHRNIADYNGDPAIEEKLPKILIVVDELADLMMAAGKEIEASICRIAQMARAVGMHLIVATQRPSVDVITGLIKANIPARVAYAVTSGVDSRTILDGIGAEDLLGQGDMLFISGQMSKPIRIQGIYVSSKEIEKVTNRVKLTLEPEYDERITSREVARQNVQGLPNVKGGFASGGGSGNDPLYDQALALIIESRKASASLLQRRLEVGYARAARILDEMESNGVIGPVRGAKPREIFVTGREEQAQ